MLLKRFGQSFEDLFTDIAKHHWGEDFEPWKPQGPVIGDYKCDGFQVSTKTVFQCHGPEQPNPSKTAAKIQKDFEGAKTNFGNRMKKWVFVYNHREIPAASGKLIDDLRERNPGLEISCWLRDDVLKFALSLSSESLGILFPGLLAKHDVNSETLDALDNFVSERKALTTTTPPNSDSTQTNQVTLDQALEKLGEQDREIRTRILGYCMWLDPLPIKRCTSLLADRGFSNASVVSDIERLRQEGLIKVTNLHILPTNTSLCEEAASQLADEFIQILSGA